MLMRIKNKIKIRQLTKIRYMYSDANFVDSVFNKAKKAVLEHHKEFYERLKSFYRLI